MTGGPRCENGYIFFPALGAPSPSPGRWLAGSSRRNGDAHSEIKHGRPKGRGVQNDRTLLSRVKSGGVVAACGLATSPVLETTLYPFLLRGVILVGIDSVGCPLRQRNEAWSRVDRQITSAALDLLREAVISLASVPEYCARLLEGRVRGRIVVRID